MSYFGWILSLYYPNGQHKKDELLNDWGAILLQVSEMENTNFKVPIYTHADKCDKHTLWALILHGSSSSLEWEKKQWGFLADFLLTQGWQIAKPLCHSSTLRLLTVSSAMI